MKFYKMTDDERRPTIEWDNKAIGPTTPDPLCPLDPSHRIPRARSHDLFVILPTSNIGDISWTWYSECVITEKIAGLFEKEGFTGYSLAPVNVTRIRRGNKDVSRLPKLWELKIIGWGGMAPPECGIKLLELCNECGRSSYTDYEEPAKLINPQNWDSSDFFMVWPLPAYIFVSERVFEFISKSELIGPRFVPVEKLPTYRERKLPGTLSPGALRLWMPEDRAHKLGDPLGIY